ncbi:MAG: cysteine--tRNA ligase [Nitriliruptorales bacterium]|nr:cysteine--tRNA ligase [Nitriliruptorales bacterium]
MSLTLHDTLQRAKIPFEPREPGRVTMYVCGPTVQAAPHVGHGRSTVVFDVLRRWLAHDHDGSGRNDVLFVANVTDIDDKIINRAQREGVSAARIATTYTASWNLNMDRLGILRPDIQPLATAHIFEMQQLISDLIEQDKAYESEGNVLFRVRQFGDYGKLSGRRIDELVAGEDLVAADVKDDPLDFAMWKAAKPGEPSWPSPWGPGRPGWHIECSAMANKHLGHGFDIHGGGLDLIFPHHENEIAQYEAAHGPAFARHWVHNGMVQMGEDKMSKSIGNVIGLGEALDEWGRGPLRLWYLSAHHRSPLVYEDNRLEDAAGAHERLLTFLRTVDLLLPGVEPDSSAAASHRERFTTAMDDDLNAPQAIAALHDLVTDGHESLAGAENGDDEAAARVAGQATALLELADDVLGLGLADQLARERAARAMLEPIVTALLDQRAQARADRNFEVADAIRDQLDAAGVVVEDRASGPIWHVAVPTG